MRIFSTILFLAVTTALTACSTVPKMQSLTEGIDQTQSGPQKQIRVGHDPVCQAFYANVIEAAKQSATAKRNNAQMASAGVSIASVFAGFGPVSSIATQSAAGLLIRRSVDEVSTTEFDPAHKFDARIIEAANEVRCPVKIKGPSTP